MEIHCYVKKCVINLYSMIPFSIVYLLVQGERVKEEGKEKEEKEWVEREREEEWKDIYQC